MSSLELPAGQCAILDAYLKPYEPAESFNPETDVLLATQDIVFELDAMADFDLNATAERMNALGYSFHINREDTVEGWILRRRPVP